MIEIAPIELVLRLAEATLGAGETPLNSNGGPFVERTQKTTGNRRGDPWCASYTTMIGTLALGDEWPVLKSGRVQTISEWAVEKGCRFLGTTAQRGDLFVLYYPSLKRHAHIGFVKSVNQDGSIETYEGNTSNPGDNDPARSREGWVVASKRRKLGKEDRVIRWINLLVTK